MSPLQAFHCRTGRVHRMDAIAAAWDPVSEKLRNRYAYFSLAWSSSRAGRPVGAGQSSDLGAVAAAELGQDVAHVGVDGALGDEQPVGDLAVGQARGDQLGDLVFAVGERQVLLGVRWCGLWG